jgi:hypothetical protein
VRITEVYTSLIDTDVQEAVERLYKQRGGAMV